MKEVFCSFEGKLNFDNQSGYVIYELEDFYQVEFLDVFGDVQQEKVRIKKHLLSDSDFGDLDKISGMCDDILYGRANLGQYFYKGKWYDYDTICKYQLINHDFNWRCYV